MGKSLDFSLVRKGVGAPAPASLLSVLTIPVGGRPLILLTTPPARGMTSFLLRGPWKPASSIDVLRSLMQRQQSNIMINTGKKPLQSAY